MQAVYICWFLTSCNSSCHSAQGLALLKLIFPHTRTAHSAIKRACWLLIVLGWFLTLSLRTVLSTLLQTLTLPLSSSHIPWRNVRGLLSLRSREKSHHGQSHNNSHSVGGQWWKRRQCLWYPETLKTSPQLFWPKLSCRHGISPMLGTKWSMRENHDFPPLPQRYI